MNYNKNGILLFIFVLLSNILIAEPLDSLKKLLFQSTQPTEKAIFHNQLTWLSYEQKQDSSLYFAQQALSFAEEHQLISPLITAELQLAEILRAQKEFDESIKHLNNAKTWIQKEDFPKERVRMFFIEGNIAYSQYKDADAMSLFEEGYLLSKQHYPALCPDFCIKLASLYSYQALYIEAKKYLEDGLSCTKEVAKKIQLYTQLGNLHAKQQQYVKALNTYQKNIPLAQSIHSEIEVSNALLNIGNIHLSKNNRVLALEFYLKSAALKEKINDQEGLAILHQNIAAVYEKQDRYDKSIDYYIKCQDYYTTTQDSASLAEIWVNIGLINIAQKKYRSAIKLLNKALTTLQGYPNPEIILIAQLNLGFSYTELGDYQKSAYYLSLAKKTAIARKDAISLVSIHNLNGVNSFYLKDYQRSIQYYEEALLLSQEIGLLDKQKFALFGLYESNESLGNAKEALDWHKQYVSIKDSLYNTATSNRLAELQEQYDSKQKEQDIKQLNIENRNIALENKLKTKQLNQFFLVIVLGALVMLFLGFIWWYRNKRQQERTIHIKTLHEKKINQIINQQEIEVLDAVVDAQQKERKGIAKEIHDTLGSFLATLKYQHEVGKELNNQDTANQEQHELMEKLISQTAAEVRSIAHQMATGEKFDFNLQAAINQLVDRIQNTQQFDLQFNYWGKEFSLNRGLELTIYRVTQELLSNVLKHAQASEATLQINQNEEEITLMVEDNGIGFTSDSEQTKGLGLRNIQERIQKINGQVNIDSHPHKGTTIILTIPIY